MTKTVKPPDDEKALLREFFADSEADDIIPRLARDAKAMQRIESFEVARPVTN